MKLFSRLRNFVRRSGSAFSGVAMQDRRLGVPIEIGSWLNKQDFALTKSTPILENIYDTIATEFSKLELVLIREETEQQPDGKDRLVHKKLNTHPNFRVLAHRPNVLQSKSEFLHTIAYQLHKYRNALVIINRDIKADKNIVLSLEPINCNDYLFGQGYVIETDAGDALFLKLMEKKTGKILLLDYDDCLHLRLNPNDIFYGDKNTAYDLTQFVRVFDENLHSLLKSLKDSGTIRGFVETGGGNYSGGFGAGLTGQGDKLDKQKEIEERFSKAGKGGVVAFDSGEKFHPIKDIYKTLTAAEVDNLMKYLYNFKGINQAVIDGTANEEQMTIFYNKTIMPIVMRFMEELNHKYLTQTARTQGQRIRQFRNPFEYTTTKELLSKMYLGAMFFTKNEVRDLALGFSPLEGGDVLLDNKNFGNLHGAETMEGGEDNDE